MHDCRRLGLGQVFLLRKAPGTARGRRDCGRLPPARLLLPVRRDRAYGGRAPRAGRDTRRAAGTRKMWSGRAAAIGTVLRRWTRTTWLAGRPLPNAANQSTNRRTNQLLRLVNWLSQPIALASRALAGCAEGARNHTTQPMWRLALGGGVSSCPARG
jgi:hypothetical protein